MKKLSKINNTWCGVLKIILLTSAGLLFAPTVNAQQEIDRLHVPAKYVESGQKVYEGYKQMFAEISEYIHKNEHITKTGIDSVQQAAFSEYFGANSQMQDILLGKNLENDNPKVQKLLKEVFPFVIKAYKPNKDLTDIADKLGKINRKAAQTLSETDADIIYTATCTIYYTAKYWQTSISEWKELSEYIKIKTEKAKNQ
jgi:hypothetical protein